jgi:integrase
MQPGAGRDPSQVKREQQRAAKIRLGNTFEAVARDWFQHWKDGCTEAYTERVLSRMEDDVFPAIGRRPIAELEPPEVLDMLRKVEARGVHDTARRLKQYVGMIFRFGIATSRCNRDPSADLKGALKSTGEPQRHKAMPRGELPAFLRKLEKYEGDSQTRLALQLTVHTFLRTGELRAGNWSEIEGIDGTSPLWRVPPERMKMRREHIVPLSRQAVVLLRDLRTLSGNSPFLFPSPGKKGIMSENTMLFALYRMGYHGRATTHGFRAVASTMLNESNLFSSDWIELQLAHVERNKIRAAYNSAQHLPERRKMTQWWSDRIDSIACEGDNVVALRA